MSFPVSFKSHINGKNAEVTIHPDRIEWSLSGLFRQKASEMIPMKMVTSVSTKKNGLRYTSVIVNASGNILDFRVSHDEAKKIKSILTNLILGEN